MNPSDHATGLAGPLLAAGFTGALVRRLRQTGSTGFWRYRLSGTIMVVMGIAIMSAQHPFLLLAAGSISYPFSNFLRGFALITFFRFKQRF